jgi:lipopolysaccharide export system protein LptA
MLSHRITMKKLFVLGALALSSLLASAEKADSLKEAVITARTIDIDDVAKKRILTGEVVVTRGTLVLKADNAVITDTPEGYMLVTLTAAPGKLATFRQKSDGGPDLWTEGQAQRIEYDERLDLVKFFATARIKRLEGAKTTDDIQTEFISYDSRKEVFVGRNDASGADKVGGGRATMILAPHKPAAGTPAASTPATATPAAK